MPCVCYLHFYIIIIKSEMDRFILKRVTSNYYIQKEWAHLKRGDFRLYQVHKWMGSPKSEQKTSL